MVRLPRTAYPMSQEEMAGFKFLDWLDALYLWPPQPDLARVAVHQALLHWAPRR